MIRLAMTLTVLLGLLPAAAAAERARIPVRIVEGKLVVFCDVSTRHRRIPANLFIELETPCGLRLHNRAAGPLRAESADGKPIPITMHFPGFEVVVPSREHGDEAMWEEFTKYHSKELGENAVIGVIGSHVLRDYHATFDLAAGFLYLEPPRERTKDRESATEPAREVSITTADSDLVWLPARYGDGEPAAMVITTGRFDSLIDARIADGLGKPAGDVGAVTVGGFDLSEYVALRPEEVTYAHKDGVFGTFGLNLLQHFRVEIDRVHKVATLTPTRPASFPVADLAFFRARVDEETGPLEEYLEQYPTERLSREAARMLLDLYLDEDGEPEDVTRALRTLDQTQKDDLRATAAFDLMKELAESGFDDAVITAGEIGIEGGRDDRYPNSVHEVHSKLGQVLLERDEGRRAWKHLLSAAFGIPEDGMVNLYLGLHYENEKRYKRAFSRFVQAVIKPESGKRAFEGLERCQRAMSGEERMSVDTIDRLIGGKVLNFGTATTYRPPEGADTSRVVLCELFTNAHFKACLAGALGNEGLLQHFPRDRVAILNWHLPSPKLEPLYNRMAARRAEDAMISRPSHLINGVIEGPGAARKDQREALFNRVRDQIEAELTKPSEYALALDSKIEDGRVRGTATVSGPKRFGRILYIVLAEKGVLFPGESEVVIHRMVARGALTEDEDGVLFEPTDER